MDLRTELSDAQKKVEPRNADSHLTFIGAGLQKLRHLPHAAARAGLLHRSRRHERRHAAPARRPSVLAYDHERVVSRTSLTHPGVEASDRLGQPRRSASGPARAGERAAVAKRSRTAGASIWSSTPTERHVGLTVNEYETLLMKNDLVDVLQESAALRADQGAQHARRSAVDSRARR